MFSLVLKELRNKSNLSQKELAKILNVSTGTVGNWEVGTRQPDYEMTIKIANFFKVSTDYLLGREKFSAEDKSSGVSLTKKTSITPLEDDMLYAFREIGKKFGVDTQKAAVLMLENMTGIKR